MLLGAARMIKREIHHKPFSPDQPTAALTQFDYFKQVIPLEHVETPRFFSGWLSCFRWFMVLENDCTSVHSHCVTLCSQPTRRREIGLFLLRWRW